MRLRRRDRCWGPRPGPSTRTASRRRSATCPRRSAWRSGPPTAAAFGERPRTCRRRLPSRGCRRGARRSRAPRRPRWWGWGLLQSPAPALAPSVVVGDSPPGPRHRPKVRSGPDPGHTPSSIRGRFSSRQPCFHLTTLQFGTGYSNWPSCHAAPRSRTRVSSRPTPEDYATTSTLRGLASRNSMAVPGATATWFPGELAAFATPATAPIPAPHAGALAAVDHRPDSRAERGASEDLLARPSSPRR